MKTTSLERPRRRLATGIAVLGSVGLLAGCAATEGTDATTAGDSSTHEQGSTAPDDGEAAAAAGDAKISLVLPGPNEYFQPWELAAEDVSEEFGTTVTFNVPASEEFNLTQQNALVDSLAAQGYNGFGFFPGDANGTNAQQQKLLDRGIVSVNINACTEDPTPALFCVSTDVYEAAAYQAEQLIEAIGGEGRIAVLTSQLTDPNTQLRIKAVEDVVAETDGAVELAQVVADIDTPQAAPPAVNALLASQGDTLDGVMSTSWNPSVAMATALTDNPEYRDITFLAAENSQPVMDALEAGFIHGTLFQNTYGMAWIGAYALHQAIANGCTVAEDAPFSSSPQTDKLIAAGVLVVDQSNMDEFIGKPESLPDDTQRMKKLLDEEVLNCEG